MTISTSSLANYTDAIEALPQQAFLGSLLWFSISQADVNLEQARADLDRLGLKKDTMRKILRPVDAFRKTSNGIAHKFGTREDIRSEFLVRDAGADTEQVHRHIILERADWRSGKKRRLLYEKVAEVVFNRGTKKDGEYSDYSVESRRTTMNLGTPLTESEDRWLTDSLDGFQDGFNHLLFNMDSHAVRSFVREYIYRLSGTCVKESGGLYFIKEDHATEVAALAEWVRSIGSEFHSLPLLNLVEQRQMIMSAFEDETIAEVQRLMGEVTKILSDPSRSIETKTFDAYGLKAAELSQKVSEYNNMLGARADRAEIEIQTYAAQVMSLAGRIRTTTAVR